jgi:hypothetical protein
MLQHGSGALGERTMFTKPAIIWLSILFASSASVFAQTTTPEMLNEVDAFYRRVRVCWVPPPKGLDSPSLKITLRVMLKPNGSLAAKPVPVAGSTSAHPKLVESAIRALSKCQPYVMFKQVRYEKWREMEITFDANQR